MCPQSGNVLKDPAAPFCQLNVESSRGLDFLRVSSGFFLFTQCFAITAVRSRLSMHTAGTARADESVPGL